MDKKLKTRRPVFKHLWRENVRKNCRNSGQEYITKSGKVVVARRLREGCLPSVCRLKCSERIIQSIREDLFKQYWKMADYQRQRDFLANCVLYTDHKVQYSLPIVSERTNVCRKFFVNTFDISPDVIREICKKKCSEDNHHSSLAIVPDRRGKVNHYKTPSKLTEQLCDYLSALPTIVKRSKMVYIDLPVYSIPQLYKRYQTDIKGTSTVSEGIFRRIFNTQFKLRFQARSKASVPFNNLNFK